MTHGLGIDIVALNEFDKIISGSTAFVERHFTAAEIRYCETAPAGALSHLAARYAAKEAAIKALESIHLFRPKLINQVNYREIEVERDPQGRPYLVFHGELKDIVKELNVNAVVSLSHDGNYAVAEVILVVSD